MHASLSWKTSVDVRKEALLLRDTLPLDSLGDGDAAAPAFQRDTNICTSTPSNEHDHGEKQDRWGSKDPLRPPFQSHPISAMEILTLI